MLQFDPYSPAVDADPFPYYRRLRDESPCFWSEEAQMWVLSRYADIVAAGQDWKTYSSASGNLMTELPNRAGATLGTTDPPRHDRLRALVQHAFMKRNLDGLAEPIRDIARDAAEELRGERRLRLQGLLGQVHRARAVRRARPALGRRGDRRRGHRAREGGADGAERSAHPRQGTRAHRRLRVDAGLRRQGDRHAPRRAAQRPDLALRLGRDRRRPARRTRGAADDDHADHGRRRVARRLHDDVRLNLADLPRGARGGGRNPGAAGRRDRGNAALQHLGAALPPPPDEGRRAARPDHAGGRLRLPRLRFGQPRRAPVPQPRRLRHRAQAARPLGFGGGVHACLGTAIARLATKIAFEEFHKVVPNYSRVADQLAWMPSSTFRSPLVLELAVH